MERKIMDVGRFLRKREPVGKKKMDKSDLMKQEIKWGGI